VQITDLAPDLSFPRLTETLNAVKRAALGPHVELKLGGTTTTSSPVIVAISLKSRFSQSSAAESASALCHCSDQTPLFDSANSTWSRQANARDLERAP